MKIAFLMYHFPVLSETFILNQITGLIDRGHHVKIYAKGPGAEPIAHAEVEKYDLLGCTTYYGRGPERMPANRLRRMVEAVGIFARNAPRSWLPLVRSMNFFRYGREASSLRIFFKAAHLIGIDQYDIVHCHFGPNGNLAALLKELGIINGRIVTTFHGEAGYTGELEYSRGYEKLFRHGDLCLPMSAKEKEDLCRLGCSQDKLAVHHMGIDTGRFSYVPRSLHPDRVVRLLTVGRLAEKKGIAYGIRAVARVIETWPQVEYRIAGHGPLRKELDDLVVELGMTDKIKLLGRKRHGEIVELMQDSDIFLAPSVTSYDGDQEGIPVVIMEAMSSGMPVISTWHSGISELVEDGKSGYLVPERDVDSLAQRLAHLVQHPACWEEMGRAGRDYVVAHHDIHRLNDRLVQLYRDLLNGSSPV